MSKEEYLPLTTHAAVSYNSDSAIDHRGYDSEDERRSRKRSELPLSVSGMRPFSTSYSARNTTSRKDKKLPRRTRGRLLVKSLAARPPTIKLRVSAYCTCDNLKIFPLLQWLQRIETGQLAGSELCADGWAHKMYLGAVHSISVPSLSTHDGEIDIMGQKDVFYFETGCIVFWGLTRAEEQEHLSAIAQFSVAPVKEIEFEDMEFSYGSDCLIVNDEITLKSTDPNEKLALSFALASSSKLDVFEQRVEETIKETNHIPESLATTGSIHYSKKDISKLIGRLFIVRTDVNLNSDMLDEPDFFWEFDEWEPIYSKMMRYLDVAHRVTVLNTRLDVLRELLDVLNQQLENQHASHLEWIIIWLILAEVLVQVVWNIFIKDILGFFPDH